MKLKTSLQLTSAVFMAFSAAVFAQAPVKLVFGTNWYPEAEHGGYYQAIAEGIYKKHGLEVSIRIILSDVDIASN